jgi:RNA polymerase sigma factor (sigma-70 family)
LNSLTDNAIMMKVRDGDLDRMGLLFERYHRQLYRFLYHMTYQREASEDMVQVVFYKMIKYRNSFTGTGEFVHWMYTIARNVLKDQGRQKKQVQAGMSVEEMADWLPDGVSLELQLEKKQAAEGLRRAMERLNADEREVLTLSRFQELKHQEVAQILNISEGAVKVRVHRAIQELKKIYINVER